MQAIPGHLDLTRPALLVLGALVVASCSTGRESLSDVPALRQLDAPFDVKRLIDRRMGCTHWTGEDPYDAERARQIARAVRALRCANLAADEAALRARYAGAPAILATLDRTADWSW